MADQQTATTDDVAPLRAQIKATTEAKNDAEARATAAEKERDKALADANKAINERVAADLTACTTSIANAETTIANAETQLGVAMEAKDASGIAKATRAIASAQNSLDNWAGQKKRIERWRDDAIAATKARAEAISRGEVQQDQRRPAGTYPAKSQAWLDAHPEIRDNPQKMKKVISAHWAAEAEDIATETPEYFKFIEKQLGVGDATSQAAEVEEPDEGEVEVKVDEGDSGLDKTPKKDARELDTAAAPSRGNGGGGSRASTRPGQMRLTASEAEVARISFPHLKTDAERFAAYAKNKIDLQKEGRLP